MKKIFLGPPGAGKGTYSKRIAPIWGIPHISTGDLFRKHLKEGTKIGKKVQTYLESGKLVPDEITVEIVKERISQDDCKNGFILDGFPRTVNQAKLLNAIVDIDVVANLVIPEDILIEKICARRVCKDCGDIYNIANINRCGVVMRPLMPKEEGKCDKCGGSLVQRNDDTEDIVKDRLKVYKEETEPLIQFYEGVDLLKNINVSREPPEMIRIILKELKYVAEKYSLPCEVPINHS